MKRLALTLLLSVVVLTSAGLKAAPLSGNLSLTPQSQKTRVDSPFKLPPSLLSESEQNLDTRFEMTLQQGGLNATAHLALRLKEGQGSEASAGLNELYYDTSLGDSDLSLGKKISSWGVGYGFRPLDVIQQQNRRELVPTTLEGVPQLSLQRYQGLNAWNLVYANPGANPGAKQARELADDESLALKGYALLDNADVHSVARYSRRFGLQLGGGLTQVLSDSLSAHASVLYSAHYSKAINTLIPNVALANSDPLRDVSHDHGLQWLLGLSWTALNGSTLLLEYWHDDFAYSEQEWQQLMQLNQQQQALAGLAPQQAIDGNTAYNRGYYRVRNVLPENLLLRLSHSGGDLEPALELLITPEDRGYVLSASAVYRLNQQTIELGARQFGGPPGSVYGEMFIDHQLYLNWNRAWN